MTISIGRKPGISLRDSGAKYVLNKIQNFSGCLSNASAKKLPKTQQKTLHIGSATAWPLLLVF